ncbi:MAG: BT1926 family outer membrane beta-barrel protein [Rikenellaceae bacterium]
MLKQIILSLILTLSCATLMAQGQSLNSSFSTDRKGKWEVSLIMGSGNYLNEALMDEDILLPGYDGLTDLGIDSDPSLYLSSDSYNYNSIANIAGLEFGYFITNNIQVTASVSATIGSTPSVDYIERVQIGDEVSMLDIPAYNYLEGRIDQRCIASVGANYYIDTRAPRISLYFGAECAYSYASLETSLPYTGEVDEDGLSTAIYQSYVSGGYAQTISGVTVAGIEYLLTENLTLGVRFSPISYTCGMIMLCPQSYGNYGVTHNDVKIFSFPKVKFGFRF